MTDPFQLARLLADANAKPTGGADLNHYQGEVISWDESSGLNAVLVNGAPISNMRVLQSGIGVTYQPGDAVMVEKRMSQWYILGKVAAPGAGAANQIASALVAAAQSTASTSYTDLATVGPAVTVYIGSSARCLVTVSATISSLANAQTATQQWIGGNASFAVSGASAISPSSDFYVGGENWYATQTVPVGFYLGGSRTTLLTAARGLVPGFNTFTMKYAALSANPGATFYDRNITVIPF
ncbi:hypothetical protein [Amycolatopsis solani]|uniref:hypothetical protein n=1 Tax=Amycolatopsis solani TaxID=3028615 RepID=UPI0025AFEADE|nr:hypothetical protein [Amycolatopsis sp. MEP2-6]